MENHRILISTAFVISLLAPQAFSYAYAGTTHASLTKNILAEYMRLSDKSFTQAEQTTIVQGAVAEDDDPRYLNHFFDPINNSGLTDRVVGEELSAPEWAENPYLQGNFGLVHNNWLNDKNTKLLEYAKDYTLERAVYEYAHGDKARALQALGHVLHLLEDMTSVPHTRDDAHGSTWALGTRSYYEDYTENFVANVEVTSTKKADTLEQLFKDTATYTNSNFLSRDTIFTKYMSPVVNIKRRDENFLLNNLGIKLISAKFTENRDGSVSVLSMELNNKEVMQSYWKNLSERTVNDGVALLDLFFREVAKERASNELAHANLSYNETQDIIEKFGGFGIAKMLYGSSLSAVDVASLNKEKLEGALFANQYYKIESKNIEAIKVALAQTGDSRPSTQAASALMALEQSQSGEEQGGESQSNVSIVGMLVPAQAEGVQEPASVPPVGAPEETPTPVAPVEAPAETPAPTPPTAEGGAPDPFAWGDNSPFSPGGYGFGGGGGSSGGSGGGGGSSASSESDDSNNDVEVTETATTTTDTATTTEATATSTVATTTPSDTTPPTIALSSVSCLDTVFSSSACWVLPGDVSASWSVSDDTATTTTNTLDVGDGTGAATTTATSTMLTLTNGDERTLTLSATDDAGNIATSTFTFSCSDEFAELSGRYARIVHNAPTLNEDKTLNSAFSPYYIKNVHTIADGATLTIPAGTVLAFPDSGGSVLQVHGALLTEGVAGDEVVFTSILDDDYTGDANNDATSTTPSAGAWNYIEIADGGMAELVHTLVRYGGHRSSGQSPHGALYVNGGTLGATALTIAYAQEEGLHQMNGTSTISESVFAYNGAEGVKVLGGAHQSTASTFVRNTVGAAIAGSTARVTDNVYTDNTNEALKVLGQPGIFSGNSGSGNGTDGIVMGSGLYLVDPDEVATLYTNDLPYVIFATKAVKGALHIDSGVTMLFKDKQELFVDGGTLTITGSSPADVRLGVYSDNPNERWKGIRLANSATMDASGFTLEYAGAQRSSRKQSGGIHIDGTGEAILANALLQNNKQNGIYFAGGVLTMNDSAVLNHDEKYSGTATGLYLLSGTATLSNISFSGNDRDMFGAVSVNVICTDCVGDPDLILDPVDLLD